MVSSTLSRHVFCSETISCPLLPHNNSNREAVTILLVSLSVPKIRVYQKNDLFYTVLFPGLLVSLCPSLRLSIPQSCLDETRALLSEYAGTLPLQEEGVGSRGTPPSNVDLVEGDFTDTPWDDASLVYAASRDLGDTAMLEIARRCLRLRDGARVVTLDTALPSVLSDFDGEREREDTVAKEFQVAWQCQVEGCWGGSAVAFVHHRVAPKRSA